MKIYSIFDLIVKSSIFQRKTIPGILYFGIKNILFQIYILYESKKWVSIMTSSIYESLREFKNRKSGCIQTENIFIEKNLVIQQSWTKIQGVIVTRSFTDYHAVRKLSIRFKREENFWNVLNSWNYDSPFIVNSRKR